MLPEADEVDVQIDEDKDLRIEVKRSSGPGGQTVNTTDSAVRITHLPTGLVVEIQDEKSQHKNKAKAMAVLRARLLEMEQREQHEAEAEVRRSMVGSGDRSEKIRTYNFPQDRVTDHRINVDLHNLPNVLDGDLDRLARRVDLDRPGRAIGRLAERREQAAARANWSTPCPKADAMDDIFAEPASHTAEKTLVARATDLAGVLVLKHDDTFLLTDARGDIELDHRGLGLYAGDTRFLSLYELRINGIRPVVLRTGNAVGYHSSLQLTNPDLVERAANMDGSEIVLRRHSLGIVRERLVADGFAELIAIDNFTMEPERARCTVRLDADYADIFEVRGLVRARRGDRLANKGDAGHVVLSYRGLDGVVRKTHVTFSPPLKLLDPRTQVTARGDLLADDGSGGVGQRRATQRTGSAGGRLDGSGVRPRRAAGPCLDRDQRRAGGCPPRAHRRRTPGRHAPRLASEHRLHRDQPPLCPARDRQVTLRPARATQQRPRRRRALHRCRRAVVLHALWP